jgi:hypothetical protein
MKLSTMLLPTGEFLLVASGCPAESQPSPEVLKSLQEKTGAVSVLFCEQDIEIENAIVDPEARRHESDELPDTWQHLGWLDGDHGFDFKGPISAPVALGTPVHEVGTTPAREFLPDPFPIGSTVKIVGSPIYNHGHFDELVVGLTGKVVNSFHPKADDERLVNFRFGDLDGEGYTWFFETSSLEPATATLEEAMDHFEGGN